ncbi:MAG: PASTA domain-containing protein [Hydrogeniiclostridium sp.]
MADINQLCMNCMSSLEGKNVCPVCGHSVEEPQSANALALKTILQNRYVVGRVKSCNSEGITYIGYDTVLHAPIELREFFPATLCSRAPGGAILVNSGSEVRYDECLSYFLSCSREVAHVREFPAITQLYDIFEENNTAYTVAEWVESIPLRYFVERSGGSLSWNDARQLFMPVLSALSAIHSTGMNHLGISPDSLRIMQDGRMKLTEFCIPAVRMTGRELPADLYAGCAALEQYLPGVSAGENTDVYGFAASLFFALTGVMPKPAIQRKEDPRLLIPSSLLKSIPPHVISALANALQVSPENRTSTFERLRAELSASPTVTIETASLQHIPPVYPSQTPPPVRRKGSVPPFVWVLVSCVCCLIVLAVIGVIWISSQNTGGTSSSEASSASSEDSSELTSEISSEIDSSSAESADMIDVPNLVGQKYEDVAEAAKGKEYQVLTAANRQFSDTVPEGSIISQTPEAGDGAKMSKGTAVVVVISQGPAIRELPEIEGMDLAAASTAVADQGFVPSKVEEYSDTVAAGLAVGYQGVKAGDEMPYGSQVLIVISKGPDPSKSE